MALTRRNFLKWAGATGIGAVVFNGCNVPDDEILVQSPLELPEDLVTGRDNFYATVFQSSSGSEGLRVRVMEGRAKKVEGNPDYPLNTGKHGARSEALLQAVYHPDRIKGPVTTAGIPGRFSPISWDQDSTSLGMSRWMTKRTFDLSMPMPKAMVATITSASSLAKAFWFAARSSSSMPAWYGNARTPWSLRKSAIWSTAFREEQYRMPLCPDRAWIKPAISRRVGPSPFFLQ